MSFRSVWRKGSVLVLGASLVASAFAGAVAVSAQAPPSLPSLIIVTGVKDEKGAAVTSGTVAALVGTTKCQEKPLGANLALEVGQPSQPDACKAATGKISFTVDGKSVVETADIKPGVPQNLALTLGQAAGAGVPGAARTGTGGYAGGGSDSGMLALALGAIALATVGGGLAVRRVRR